MQRAKSATTKVGHGLSLMSNLTKLRKKQILCDFTIQVDSTPFRVHRTVLAGSSKYFRRLLSRDVDEGIVYISGIEPDATERCIEFMYSGEVNDIDVQNSERLLNAADLLQLKELVKLCFTHLENNINSENCFYIRNVAAVYENRELIQALNRFLVHNIKDIVETKDFQELSKSDMQQYIQLCQGSVADNFCQISPTRVSLSATASDMRASKIFLSASCGRKVRSRSSGTKNRKRLSAPSSPIRANTLIYWKGVINWISHDIDERGKHLFELANFINMTKLPVSTLSFVIWNEPLIQLSTPCKDVIASRVLSSSQQLKNGVNLQNCFNMYKIATGYPRENFKENMEVIITFMVTNIKNIKKRTEIELWSKDEICMFIKFSECLAPKEQDIWELALTWFRHDNERKHCSLELLQALSVQRMSPYYLIESVLKEPAVKESSSCVSHIIQAVFFDTKSLVWNIDLNTCFTLKYLARTHKNTPFGAISQYVLSFFITNFLKIMEQPEFRCLLFEEVLHLCKILKKRNIHGEAKWTAVMKWVKYKPEERKHHLPALLRTMNFERLSSMFMRETVRQEPLIQKMPECNKIVTTAVYDMLP